jgi:hypothetical protein
MNIKLRHKHNAFNKWVYYEIDSRDLDKLKMALLEKSQVTNIGDVFIYDPVVDKWDKLCYYNDL